MILVSLILLTSVLIVAVLLIVWLWRRESKTKVDWLLRFAIAGTYVVGMVLFVPWPRVSLHLRWVFLGALLAAAVVSFRRALAVPFYARKPIGQVGNSGNTSDPHLHIHAVRFDREVSPEDLLRQGTPVPLLVEGRFLIRNNTF